MSKKPNLDIAKTTYGKDILPEWRVKIAGDVVASYQYDREGAILLYQLLLNERSDHMALKQKVAGLTEKTKELSKELSALKRKK